MGLFAPLCPQLLANLPLMSFLQLLHSFFRNALKLQHQIMRSVVLVLVSRQIVEEFIQRLGENLDLLAHAVCDVA
jgi:hypothetical protein